MSDEITSINAKHLATKQGEADHGGYVFGMVLLAFITFMASWMLALQLISIKTDADVWKAMRACPPTYTRILNDRGELKDCILTDKLATPRSQ